MFVFYTSTSQSAGRNPILSRQHTVQESMVKHATRKPATTKPVLTIHTKQLPYVWQCSNSCQKLMPAKYSTTTPMMLVFRHCVTQPNDGLGVTDCRIVTNLNVTDKPSETLPAKSKQCSNVPSSGLVTSSLVTSLRRACMPSATATTARYTGPRTQLLRNRLRTCKHKKHTH